MEYQFSLIEKKWQQYWKEKQIYKTENKSDKPKFYVLDMFPYPSGSGLHVGHPLGYIASDIFSRYKRLKGFNVLHPMGFDAFGLPAEQYAIQTGQHPAITTEKNLARYKEQLDNLGFSFDWSREVKTSDPAYYKWTQWIFIQLFNSWYNKKTNKAERIETLIAEFEKPEGNYPRIMESETTLSGGTFSGTEWKQKSEDEKQQILMHYRLAYLSDSMVNWCPELGTVLAEAEVKDGLSERGGFPVERKLMKQWSLKISAYAERLLEGLNKIDWTESIKEIQRNWIGRSEGSSLQFKIDGHPKELFEVFTTRPDTIFGVSFVVLAPEHKLVSEITTADRKEAVEKYIQETKSRSERDRMSDVKRVSGEFTGAYVIHPFNGNMIPVWIADYVLLGYGTGAVMAVPSGDSRDFAFAKHFNLPIIPIVKDVDISNGAYEEKEGILMNSDFLNDLDAKAAIKKAIEEIEKMDLGKGKVNYRMRDAIFSRQRYWGEPIPIYYKNETPYALAENELPLELPEVDAYLPTETGEPPLGRAKNWKPKEGERYEYNTMPGWAGSSWYFLRYMDPKNEHEFVSKQAENYWQDVDLYIGGAEHATGHLLYARFWQKFLFDLGFVSKDEPFKKLINQGMILGISSLVYRVKGSNQFVSYNLRKEYDTTPIRVDITLEKEGTLNTEAFKQWRKEFADATFILEDGKYICGHETEKMSKSFNNVVNPDDVIAAYGTDTMRLYEMFLGPLEQFKPWDTHGIEGVYRFLKKLWRLFHDNNNDFCISNEAPTKEELKALHKAIKKVEEDIERFSFNTSVSTFMICVNELADLKCNKQAILNDLLIILSPYAPHIAEELWQLMGHNESICHAQFPKFKPEYLIENSFDYPVSFNGKMRFKINLALSLNKEDIERMVMEAEQTQKLLEGKPPKKVIVVPNKIVNIVI